jgi:solute carrier family 35 protein F5
LYHTYEPTRTVQTSAPYKYNTACFHMRAFDVVVLAPPKKTFEKRVTGRSCRYLQEQNVVDDRTYWLLVGYHTVDCQLRPSFLHYVHCSLLSITLYRNHHYIIIIMAEMSSYGLGLVFIVLVSVIWSAASVLVQYLYTDQSFDSPFLLTYIGTSLFTILLPLEWLTRHCKKHNNGDNNNNNNNNSINNGAEYESISNHNNQNIDTDIDIDNNNTKNNKPWSVRDHFFAAAKIAPVWFISNYSYNASLKFTSITSSTVLACTGSLFTFLFALLLRDEHFSCLKLLGVLLGMTGSILTGLHDVTTATITTTATSTATDLSLWGDALGLSSAVGYGAYAIMVRILCPRDESLMSMRLFLGFVGLFNMICLSPIVVFTFWSSSAAAAPNLSLLVFGCLIAKGLLDNVLGDYLWARSVVLTSATVASVGLGLTIPLAFLSDIVLGRPNVLNVVSVFGALSVLTGFLLVNLGQQQELHTEETEEEGVEELEVEQHQHQQGGHAMSAVVKPPVGEETPLERQPAPSSERLHMSIEYTDTPPPSPYHHHQKV